MTLTVTTARRAPEGVDVLGVPVAQSGPVPRVLGLSRAALGSHGFEGKPGQVLTVPVGDGPTLVALGVGAPGSATPATLRAAAAALARAARHRRSVATTLVDVTGPDTAAAAQAVAEGLVLGDYRFTRFKKEKGPEGLQVATIVTGADVADAVARGQAVAEAQCLARDLANTPPGHLTAVDFAEVAQSLAEEMGLDVEVFDEERIAAYKMGGVLGVNQGSTEPPRVVKLTYSPPRPKGTVVLVGKGIMYDSGGISLKPSDGMHVLMKMDMTGAAVVLATMSVLPVLAPRVKVVGLCMCTDNMPSGSAMKLGDVLTIRNGTTVEIHNTDAEGRLVLADGLSLAMEERPDAILDIATLTGAVLAALGKKIAGVMGNHDGWIEQLRAASARTDEQVWPLPLPPEYRKLLDSNVADLKNIGGPYGGALTAGLFLKEFVGDVPWAHVDIAGVMDSDAEDGWLAKGSTGFGVRLFADLLAAFTPPKR